MKDRQGVLVCASIIMDPLVPSVVAQCEICDHNVWVSSSMYPRVVTEELFPICMKRACTEAMQMRFESPPVAALHPDQMAQLEEFMITDFARDFVRRWNEQNT